MTDDQKYSEILKELGELISQKNMYIATREFQIENLKRQLEVAENKIKEIRKE